MLQVPREAVFFSQVFLLTYLSLSCLSPPDCFSPLYTPFSTTLSSHLSSLHFAPFHFTPSYSTPSPSSTTPFSSTRPLRPFISPLTHVHLYVPPSPSRHNLTDASFTPYSGIQRLQRLLAHSLSVIGSSPVSCGGRCKQTVTSHAHEPITAGNWCRIFFFLVWKHKSVV